MNEVRDALSVALRSLIGMQCKRSLATNSLKISFDFQASERGQAYIWMDPPWRMTLDGHIVTGSADWPVWDGVEDKEVNQPLWEAWSALFNSLNSTVLVGASVNAALPDLCLDFASGHRIETFGNSGDGCWWYYRDRITGEVFEAGAAGICHEFAEAAASDPRAT
jgi:hypothetical protein